MSAYDDYDGDDYYGYNESFKSRSNARKHKMNETSYAPQRQRYASNGDLAFYKNSNKRDIIEMSEFAFAIARTIIKRSEHSSEYAELLEDILSDPTFSYAMHGATLPDLSNLDKLEQDLQLYQSVIPQCIENDPHKINVKMK